MIKEKLLFYNDYSSINKKCFSCQQFNHIIEECPKLHFVPNVEKIVKQNNYPHLNERSFHNRTKKKSINCLLLAKGMKEKYNKFKKRLKTLKTMNREQSGNESSSSSDTLEEIEEEEKEEEEIKSVSDTNSNPKRNLYEQQQPFTNCSVLTEEVGSIKEPKDTFASEFQRMGSIKGSQKRHEYISKQSDSLSRLSKKEEINGISPPTNANQPEVVVKKEMDLDRVFIFKNYFPNFNIDNIIKNYSKSMVHEKEIYKKYTKKKYFNLKNYTFYANEILSKFLNESKIKKK